MFSDLANSHGHYTKGSLSGLANQNNSKLLSTTTTSPFEMQANQGKVKLTPDTALAKASEKISRVRPKMGQETAYYQLKSSTSADFFKDLLEAQVENLSNRLESQEDLCSMSPQMIYSSQGVSSQITLGERSRPLCPKPSADNIIIPLYSNSHLGQIMEELRLLVDHKDLRICKLESENTRMRAILASHKISFEQDGD